MRLTLNPTSVDTHLSTKRSQLGILCCESLRETLRGCVRNLEVLRGFLQRGSLFSDGLVLFTYTRPPNREQVQSRRVWILAHRSFHPPAGLLFISEASFNHIAENGPVSPEPPAPLLRKRGGIEPDGFGIQPLPDGVGVDCVQLILARALEGESMACTHHSLWGPSWLSFLRAHEETEYRKQPATRERGAVLNEWEGLVGGGDGNLAHWRDSIAAGLRLCVCFAGRRVTLASCRQKKKAPELLGDMQRDKIRDILSYLISIDMQRSWYIENKVSPTQPLTWIVCLLWEETRYVAAKVSRGLTNR
jgi:hypothetical protein